MKIGQKMKTKKILRMGTKKLRVDNQRENMGILENWSKRSNIQTMEVLEKGKRLNRSRKISITKGHTFSDQMIWQNG